MVVNKIGGCENDKRMRFMKEWVKKRCVSSLSNEMRMVLLALTCGHGDFKPHVAEKSFLVSKQSLNS